MRFSEKDFEYFEYIIEHKKNVMIAYNILCDLKLDLNEVNLDRIRSMVLEHDISKFKSEEFLYYRTKFFKRDDEIAASEKYPEINQMFEKDFSKAWQYHYMNNPHHPEYFGKGVLKEIHHHFQTEMVLDWCAMSFKFKNSPLAYYYSKKDKLINDFGNSLDYKFIELLLVSMDKEVCSRF